MKKNFRFFVILSICAYYSTDICADWLESLAARSGRVVGAFKGSSSAESTNNEPEAAPKNDILGLDSDLLGLDSDFMTDTTNKSSEKMQQQNACKQNMAQTQKSADGSRQAAQNHIAAARKAQQALKVHTVAHQKAQLMTKKLVAAARKAQSDEKALAETVQKVQLVVNERIKAARTAQALAKAHADRAQKTKDLCIEKGFGGTAVSEDGIDDDILALLSGDADASDTDESALLSPDTEDEVAEEL
ncbi:MAG: hypothetical protein H6849_02595 [Alphaproteobacteria bacterium]|nr:MAG: hypothetical protein H6849_02595 [Alphaproteobacteria bacterium]